jgi:hypothetical protein
MFSRNPADTNDAEHGYLFAVLTIPLCGMVWS